MDSFEMQVFEDKITKLPSSERDKYALVARLWNLGQQSNFDEAEFDRRPYFAYYRQQCSFAFDDEENTCVSTHKDILEVANQVEQGATRDGLRHQISLKYPNQDGNWDADQEGKLNNSIDLAVRLVSMIDIGASCHLYRDPEPVKWEHGSLREFVCNHFKKSIEIDKNIKLGVDFNARQLARLGLIRMDWTDNLADHLKFVDDGDKRVSIFHHASFLKFQRNSILPPDLVSETLSTLALLFPQSDKQTAKWFTKIKSKYPYLDGQMIKCGGLTSYQRKIENFPIWHDRLVILKEELDNTKPSTIAQFWYDRRNGVQWYTFWVAVLVLILTIFFGVVQSIEGALQV